MSILHLSHITKSYPDGEHTRNEVLRDINMEVDAGAFIAITGASGSGKTTLLSILGLLIPPDGGSYRLDGEETFAPSVDRTVIRNRKIGFVFQEHRLLPQYTALDNILLPTLAFQRQADASQITYARQLMELTGIAALERKYPPTLSGGESSRTALCRALVMKPVLLLADEPTGQLDAVSSQTIVSLLRQINKELGTTILMVTHSPEVAATTHHIQTLENGIIK
ncbi:Lipoprotein-releasing system ATP-binding protein LolD [termite gut metagenome]|uniref:Lipoprotein-releasing system ATP-binding protein LolD n=1 Tax=termite gut metagenome TaxID=433724 RepID=A0A5J4SQY3_9ZZZZ